MVVVVVGTVVVVVVGTVVVVVVGFVVVVVVVVEVVVAVVVGDVAVAGPATRRSPARTAPSNVASSETRRIIESAGRFTTSIYLVPLLDPGSERLVPESKWLLTFERTWKGTSILDRDEKLRQVSTTTST